MVSWSSNVGVTCNLGTYPVLQEEEVSILTSLEAGAEEGTTSES